MKKIINSPDTLVDDMLKGLCAGYPQYIRRVPGSNVVVRSKKKTGRVALVSGGGSGHEPAHGGFVGEGMLDAAVSGEVFTSPTPDEVLKAIDAVKTAEGTLLVIKNYTGDVLNFEMAADMAQAEGVNVAKVIVNDDAALEAVDDPERRSYTTGRRGIIGTIFVHKIAGAAAEAGLSLEEVTRIAEKTVANVSSMGMALGPCTVPAAGRPGFVLGEDEVEIGLGIHGEPGVSREKLRSADETVKLLMDRLLPKLRLSPGDETAVFVNSLGGTPLMELCVANNAVNRILTGMGVKIHHTDIGAYMTAIEMPGFSISVLKLDEELKTYYDAKADTIVYKRFG